MLDINHLTMLDYNVYGISILLCRYGNINALLRFVSSDCNDFVIGYYARIIAMDLGIPLKQTTVCVHHHGFGYAFETNYCLCASPWI